MSQTVEAGGAVELRAVARSPSLGLAFQWFFNQTNALAGATDDLLQLTNVQRLQAGSYTAVAMNAYGSVTSAPALLSVIHSVDRRVVPTFYLSGRPGSLLHVQYADSLATPQWSSLSDVPLDSGSQLCFDLSQPQPVCRFYRAWQTDGPPPELDASLGTEIPLAGSVGDKVRIDYINQFGPTDAWVTLDTVTLTNTTQLYYDLTMFRQPLRLYRLVPVP